MGLLGKRKNKQFSYQPRFYEGEGNPYEIRQKFDEFRVTIGSDRGLKTKFFKALTDFRKNQNQEANTRVVIIISVLVLLFLIIIDFDFSIFKIK